jgi:hypothetical protein
MSSTVLFVTKNCEFTTKSPIDKSFYNTREICEFTCHINISGKSIAVYIATMIGISSKTNIMQLLWCHIKH